MISVAKYNSIQTLLDTTKDITKLFKSIISGNSNVVAVP